MSAGVLKGSPIELAYSLQFCNVFIRKSNYYLFIFPGLSRERVRPEHGVQHKLHIIRRRGGSECRVACEGLRFSTLLGGCCVLCFSTILLALKGSILTTVSQRLLPCLLRFECFPGIQKSHFRKPSGEGLYNWPSRFSIKTALLLSGCSIICFSNVSLA